MKGFMQNMSPIRLRANPFQLDSTIGVSNVIFGVILSINR
jgi:hypothetical protein